MHDCHFFSRVVLALCLGVSLVSLPACSQNKVAVSPTDVTIDAFSRHTSTRIAQGQMLTVKLPTTTRSTFSWRLTPDSNEGNHVWFVDRKGQVTAENSIAYGDDEAMDVFAFKAGQPGMQTLNFIYDYQPGCPESKSARMTLFVEVYNAREEALAKAKEEARQAKLQQELAQQATANESVSFESD